MMTWPPLITPAAYWWAAEARQGPQPSLAGCPVSDPQTGQRLVCGHRWSPACPLCAESRTDLCADLRVLGFGSGTERGIRLAAPCHKPGYGAGAAACVSHLVKKRCTVSN